MSFALTTEQVRNRTKTVTRRLGWGTATVGDVVQPVVKGQGLKKGETVEKIGGPIRFVKVTRERLSAMTQDDVRREALPHCYSSIGFVQRFCREMRVRPSTFVTRIEFEYVEAQVREQLGVRT